MASLIQFCAPSQVTYYYPSGDPATPDPEAWAPVGGYSNVFDDNAIVQIVVH
jgi:hypothetical protein